MKGYQGKLLHKTVISILAELLKDNGYHDIVKENQNIKNVVPDITASRFNTYTEAQGRKTTKLHTYAFQVESVTNKIKEKDRTDALRLASFNNVIYINLDKIDGIKDIETSIKRLKSQLETYI